MGGNSKPGILDPDCLLQLVLYYIMGNTIPVNG
jgi:hypothetical protein